ncbi:transporter substrate-binding domain-containing protein [uncultured Aquitalea sp.]|uniref:substrate-binding periplasmic protein n=2 Tax=uncultured Aquitalea sp. TaxID=540272 RepID=UPI0025D1C677|nr:transporter substrate-binding domain-containing protein [uncultured Aquitalea sp.]
MLRSMLIGTALSLCLALPAFAADIAAYTEELPPLNYQRQDQVAGFASDLLAAMADKAGLSVSRQVLPWPRAYAMVQNTPDTLLYSTTRTPEREDQFRWVGPIGQRRIYLYRLERRKDIRLHTQDQLLQYRVSAMFESASQKRLQEMGLVLDKELDVGRSDLVNLTKLKAGRVDMVAMLDWAMAWQLPQAGMKPTDVKPAALLDGRHQYWFALNRQTSELKAQRLQAALDGLVKSGFVDHLRQRYLGKDAAPADLADFSRP